MLSKYFCATVKTREVYSDNGIRDLLQIFVMSISMKKNHCTFSRKMKYNLHRYKFFVICKYFKTLVK